MRLTAHLLRPRQVLRVADGPPSVHQRRIPRRVRHCGGHAQLWRTRGCSEDGGPRIDVERRGRISQRRVTSPDYPAHAHCLVLSRAVGVGHMLLGLRIQRSKPVTSSLVTPLLNSKPLSTMCTLHFMKKPRLIVPARCFLSPLRALHTPTSRLSICLRLDMGRIGYRVSAIETAAAHTTANSTMMHCSGREQKPDTKSRKTITRHSNRQP